jgi:hypothetical protein
MLPHPAAGPEEKDPFFRAIPVMEADGLSDRHGGIETRRVGGFFPTFERSSVDEFPLVVIVDDFKVSTR